VDKYLLDDLLAWEVKSSSPSRNARFECTFDSVADKVVCTGKVACPKEGGGLPPSLSRETL